jgi:hypothetical protein
MLYNLKEQQNILSVYLSFLSDGDSHLVEHIKMAAWCQTRTTFYLPKLKHWGRGFETYSRYGCLHLFYFCVVL